MEPRFVSQADGIRINNASLNYRRAMHFFKLANEQIRLFDTASAEAIQAQYLEPLHRLFENYLSRIPWEYMDRESRRRVNVLEALGAAELDRVFEEEHAPRGPPGFGLQELGLREADRGQALSDFESLMSQAEDAIASSIQGAQGIGRRDSSAWGPPVVQKTSISTDGRGRPYTSDTSSTDRHHKSAGRTRTTSQGRAAQDFGPIGPARPSAILAARKAREATSNTSLSYQPYDFNILVDRLSRLTGPELPSTTSPAAFEPRFKATSHARHFDSVASDYDLMEQEPTVHLPGSHEPKRNDDRTTGSPNGAQEYASSSEYMSPGESFYTADTSFASNMQDKDLVQASHLSNVPPLRLNTATAVEKQVEPESALSSQTDNTQKASSWAKIAAISTDALGNGPSSNGAKPHITLTLASPLPTPTAATKTPTEPMSEQLRVVWLARLPPKYRTRDVSAHITEGPVMSILLQKDAHESLPGLSACIIFMLAEHAAQYLTSNGFDIARDKQTGLTKYAADVETYAAVRPKGSGNNKSMNRSASDAAPASSAESLADITIFRGAAYAMDAALASMAHPTHARRRVKWSRSRLFYDVSLRQFKRDVLALVGGPANVEFFHFYNPGECTVVFSSVSVAAAAVDGFAAYARARKDPVAVTTLEEEGRAGGATAEGRLDGKKGRYEGVEVGYVRDFNEAPPGALWSQYGKDGQLKPSSRAEGCEGIFEGPEV